MTKRSRALPRYLLNGHVNDARPPYAPDATPRTSPASSPLRQSRPSITSHDGSLNEQLGAGRLAPDRRLVLIRRERTDDWGAVDAVVSAAFAGPRADQEPPETLLVRALRRDAGWIPTLSMVAVHDVRIVGHVVCTRGWIGEISALGLGPISVLPDYQRQGIGQALMRAIIGAADAAGESLIALLGDHHFYGRFGFVAASQLGIVAPDPGWRDHFQVRALSGCPTRFTGTFRYAEPFADV